MPTVDEWIDQGLLHQHRGELEAARNAYQQALAIDRLNPDALNLDGVAALQQGHVEQAIERIQTALVQDPQAAEFHGNLGEAFLAQRELTSAIKAWETALELDPSLLAIRRRLATAYVYAGNLPAAIESWRSVTVSTPDDADAWNNLGVVLQMQRQDAEAVEPLRRAITLKPAFATALETLVRGLMRLQLWADAIEVARTAAATLPPSAAVQTLVANALNAAGQFSAGLAVAREAVLLDRDYGPAHFQLGRALEGLGEFEGAALAYTKTSQLQPDRFAPHLQRGFALLAAGNAKQAMAAFDQSLSTGDESMESCFNLAIAFDRAGLVEKAVEYAERAAELAPQRAEPLCLLGGYYSKLGRVADAERAFGQAIKTDPTFSGSHINLSNLYAEAAEPERAIAILREAIEAFPNDPQVRGGLLLSLCSSADLSPQEIFAEHAAWGKLFPDPVDGVRHPTHRPAEPRSKALDPDRRLRIGYMSPDFRGHAVSFFISSLLRNHDRVDFEIICYDNSIRPDMVTRQLKTYVDGWVRIVGASDENVEKQIRSDGIDILIDLAGHTGDNRLPVFAKRPAPIQMTYLGYPNTTGLTQIDYRFTDAEVDPPGLADTIHTERLLRLPAPFICYSPLPSSPDVSELPAASNGYITFGSFNNLTKLTDVTIDLWCSVVLGVSNSRLVLKSAGFKNEEKREKILARFAARGLDRARIEGLPRTNTFAEHLKAYERLDIGLDSFPYNGTTTTCEALWMGVPVVTLAGPTHVSRVSSSLLKSVGMGDCVAQTPADYAQIAKRLAADVAALAAVRADLRRRVMDSDLMNAPKKTAAVERLYREAWRQWCASAKA